MTQEEISQGDSPQKNVFSQIRLTNLPGIALLVFDHDLRFQTVEGQILEEIGYPSKSLIGKKLQEVVPKEALPELLPHYLNALEGLETEIERAIRNSCYRARFGPIRDQQGQIIGGMVFAQDITAQRQAENALAEREALHRALLKTNPDGIILSDAQGKFLEFNQAACEILGRTAEELSSLQWQDIVDIADPRLERAIEERTNRGVVRAEHNVTRRDGSVIPVEGTSTRFTDPEGNPRTWSVIRDISERKHQEQILHASEARYRLLADNSSDVIIQLDNNFEFAYVSPSIERVLGYTIEEFQGRSSLDFVHPDDVSRLLQFRQEISHVQSAVPSRIEIRFRHKEGHWVWIERNGVPLFSNRSKEPTGHLATLRDITARHQVEEALETSEARYRSLINTVAEGIVMLDQNGAIQICNPAAERILGLTADQLKGRTTVDPRWQAIHEDGSPFPGETHPASIALQAGHPITGAIMGVHQPNGDVRWLSVNAQPIFDSSKNMPHGVVATFTDITNRRYAEIALRESEARYRLLVENSLDGIMMGDKSGQILTVNPAMCRIFGRTEADLYELPMSAILDPSDPHLEPFLAEQQQAHSLRSELTALHGDGTPFPIELMAVNLPSPEHTDRYWCIIRDLTQEKRYHATLVEQETLKATLAKELEISRFKSKMMEQLAHEFRTPLAVIQTTVETITTFADRLSPEQRAAKRKNVVHYIRRITDMVDEIALAIQGSFVPAKLDRIPVDLGSLCEKVASELEFQLQILGKYQLDIAPSAIIMGDPFTLQTLIFHVMHNAAQFCNPSDPVQVHLTMRSDGFELTVSDLGLGVLPGEKDRLFEPFFRGSNIGTIGGLGLGLTIVKACLDVYQGTIQIAPNSPRGTIVKIWLPDMKIEKD